MSYLFPTAEPEQSEECALHEEQRDANRRTLRTECTASESPFSLMMRLRFCFVETESHHQ